MDTHDHEGTIRIPDYLLEQLIYCNKPIKVYCEAEKHEGLKITISS